MRERKKMKKRRGFTLLELLIVIGILTVLLAVSVGQYKNYVSSAKVVDILSAYEIVSKATKLYNQDTSYFPQDIRELWKKDAAENIQAPEGWKGPYITLRGGIVNSNYYPILGDQIKGTIECVPGGTGTGKVNFVVTGDGLSSQLANEVINRLGSIASFTTEGGVNKLTIQITTAEAEGGGISCK